MQHLLVQHCLCNTACGCCATPLVCNTTVLVLVDAVQQHHRAGSCCPKTRPHRFKLSLPPSPFSSVFQDQNRTEQSCSRYLLGGGAGKETLVDMRVKVDQNTFKIPSTFKSPPTTSVRNKRRENWFALREQPVQGFIGLSNQCKVESAPLLAFFFSSPFTQRVSHSVLAFSDHFFISTH